MSQVILDRIEMKRESKSYIDSLYAVLTATELFAAPKYMLAGLSGMSFKFAVHEDLLPLSVTAYGLWNIEHQPAVDNLGFYSENDGGYTRHPTFSYYQREAVPWVKQSLDKGVGVIYWLPEFGVIYGYDDEDGVFYIQNGQSKDFRVVLYDNFGLNSTRFWSVQVIGDKVDVDPKDQLLESIRLAIQDWNTPYKTLPNKDIASGKLAFTFLVNGLNKGDFHEQGAVYILDSYLYSRSEIVHFLRDSRHLLPGLDDAFQIYKKVHELNQHIPGCMTNENGVRVCNRNRIRTLTSLLSKVEKLEDEAHQVFSEISGKYPDLRRSFVPRWGAHTPR